MGERLSEFGKDGVEGDIFKNLADERVAIRMRAGGAQAEKQVTGLQVRAREEGGAVNDAHDRSGHVKFSRQVHAGHLCGLAAEQRAPGLAACGGDPAHHCDDHLGVKSGTCNVVEKKEGPRTLHEDVVDAVVDDVVPDGLESSNLRGEFHFCAHTIEGWTFCTAGTHPSHGWR
jgi:hypothetical protein